MVDNAMNCLPPACMTSNCAQMGEPYSHRRDPDSGQWRPTYATFRRVTSSPDGLWMYCGHCFQGENRERGADFAASAALPEWCYSTLLDTGMVIILKRGETGYYKTDIPFTSKENARALADEYNRRMGVTKAQEAAISRLLKDETLEEHLEGILDQLCNQLPEREYDRISKAICLEREQNQ